MRRREMLRSSCMAVGTSLLSRFQPYTSPITPQANISTVSGMRSFRISFGKDRIKDLYRRIDSTVWPEMPFDTGWSAGTNDRVLRDLVQYWRHKYDWFVEQEKMNQLPHLRGPVGGEQMHVVHFKASSTKARFPLLMIHGWPSSFLEYVAGAQLLTKGVDGGPAFDVLVPSLPGFVFSESPRSPGMHPGKIAERMHLMMREFGYQRYGVVGYDWGGLIVNELGLKFPDAVIGLHKMGAPWLPPPQGKAPTAEEQSYIAHRAWFDREESGYGRIQGTKPQTLSYALQDSPLGLLAWILEKYWAWSDHGDDLWETLDRRQVLNTVMLYWLTGKVLSAARIYFENDHRPESEKTPGSIAAPIAFARFPKDPLSVQRPLVGQNPLFENVIQVHEMSRGGHFPALEVPDLWAKDVAAFFSTL